MKIEITARDSKEFAIAEKKLAEIKEYSNSLYKQIRSAKINFFDGKTLVVSLDVSTSNPALIALPKGLDGIKFGSGTYMAYAENDVTYTWEPCKFVENQVLTYNFI